LLGSAVAANAEPAASPWSSKAAAIGIPVCKRHIG